MNSSIWAGWLGSAGGKNPSKKIIAENAKSKRWSEWSNSSKKLNTLMFPYWGGQGRNPGWLFDFHSFHQNILKVADINFFFKVLAKFGDYKDNKVIKKIVSF